MNQLSCRRMASSITAVSGESICGGRSAIAGWMADLRMVSRRITDCPARRTHHRRDAKHDDEQVARYFGSKFYTGLRTSESLAQRWDWVDWRRSSMGISEAVVLGIHKSTTKTHVVRHVQLNSMALGFLRDQKPATFLQPHSLIFPDPRTGER